jgi:hypothetical protein
VVRWFQHYYLPVYHYLGYLGITIQHCLRVSFDSGAGNMNVEVELLARYRQLDPIDIYY